MVIRPLAILLLAACVPSVVGASGTYGRSPARDVDPIYEQGKAVFTGQLRSYGRISFCVRTPGSDTGTRVTKQSLKSFKGATKAELADSILDCDAPERPARDVLASTDLVAVVHYLNTRYRLRLRG
ncbi:MAG: hypothetical protein AAFX85_09295 [Pseudomonadota bacterium]